MSASEHLTHDESLARLEHTGRLVEGRVRAHRQVSWISHVSAEAVTD